MVFISYWKDMSRNKVWDHSTFLLLVFLTQVPLVKQAYFLTLKIKTLWRWKTIMFQTCFDLQSSSSDHELNLIIKSFFLIFLLQEIKIQQTTFFSKLCSTKSNLFWFGFWKQVFCSYPRKAVRYMTLSRAPSLDLERGLGEEFKSRPKCCDAKEGITFYASPPHVNMSLFPFQRIHFTNSALLNASKNTWF